MEVVARALKEAGVLWALGGSRLLMVHGVVEMANDVDLLVAEADAERVREIFAELGTGGVGMPKEPYHTKSFFTYEIEGQSYDVMGGLRIAHEAGVFRYVFDQRSISGEQDGVPLSSLEDWYVLYSLMPGKENKVELLEAKFRRDGIARPELLRRSLEGELPSGVRERIAAWL